MFVLFITFYLEPRLTIIVFKFRLVLFITSIINIIQPNFSLISSQIRNISVEYNKLSYESNRPPPRQKYLETFFFPCYSFDMY